MILSSDFYGNEYGDWVFMAAGQYPGNGNLNVDPLFCDPEQGDLSLHRNSPCAARVDLLIGMIGARGVGCDEAVCDGEGAFSAIPRVVRAMNHREASLSYAPDGSLGGVIRYELPTDAQAEPGNGAIGGQGDLAIYALSGRLVRRIGIPRLAATREIRWDGRDQTGRELPSGVYFFSLEGDGIRASTRALVVK